MFRMKKMIVGAILGATSCSAWAIQVDKSEIFVPCGEKKIQTSVFNDSDQKMYLNVNLGEYERDAEGNLTGSRKNYDPKSFKDVNIIASPKKAILGPEEERKIDFVLFDTSCDAKKDQLYSVEYLPSSVPGEDSSVSIMIGMGGIITVLAKEANLSYTTQKSEDGILVKNTGNSVITGKVVRCDTEEKECKASFRVHHGREFFIKKSVLGDFKKIILTSPAQPTWKEEVLSDEINNN